MKIWIDLANAPHVAFFLPIIRELESHGHEVEISIRDFNQTAELTRLSGLGGEVVGCHGGASSWGKLVNLLKRSLRLAAFGAKIKADVAVSHNSYTHTIAGRVLGARVVTMMDYEGQPANHIAFRMAHRVIVPACFPTSDLHKFGARESKVWRYEGFKEQVYLSDYEPNGCFVDALTCACSLGKGWDPLGTVLITVRSPACMAAYHHFENLLFEKLLCKLNALEGATVILLPRTIEQVCHYKAMYPRLCVPTQPISGNDLVFYSDLVISAGGTMNREAAVLGTPAYTIFAGELPEVDKFLIKMGRLIAIQKEQDIDDLLIARKKRGCTLCNHDLKYQIAEKIVSW